MENIFELQNELYKAQRTILLTRDPKDTDFHYFLNIGPVDTLCRVSCEKNIAGIFDKFFDTF